MKANGLQKFRCQSEKLPVKKHKMKTYLGSQKQEDEKSAGCSLHFFSEFKDFLIIAMLICHQA